MLRFCVECSERTRFSYTQGESKKIMYYIYILRSAENDLYIGQTNNLDKRVKEHVEHLEKAAKFTKEHDGFKLVYKELFGTRLDAMRRENQLKGWTRAKKEALISGDFELLKRL